ncbi:tail spike protein, capsular polysaccharide depolymerase [Acinetobacter phage Scipio]|nr:tail spike protein, capsular polysaccharide depolymerase [Acinetobacter phage Scipio]
MTNPTLITTPFAENGDKNIIPESVGANPQNATMQAGFPPITQQKISEGGIPPERNDFNGMFNLVTQHLVHLNNGMSYEFDQEHADKIGGYPLNARLMLTNGDIVRSTIANNTANPNVDMAGWDNPQKYLKTQVSFYATPENFGSTDGDAYNALQSAFNSGLKVQLAPNKTYLTSKTLTHGSNFTLHGYNSKIVKTTLTTSGLAPIAAPTGAGDVIYDRDAVLIAVPSPEGYVTGCDISGVSLEKSSANNFTGYGYFAPYLAQSTFKNFVCKVFEYAIYTVNCWMTEWVRCQGQGKAGWVLGGLTGDLVRGGTSTNLISCWSLSTRGGYYAWNIYNMHSSNFLSASSDFIGTETDVADGVWNIVNCENITLLNGGCELVHAKQLFRIRDSQVAVDGWYFEQFYNRYGGATSYLIDIDGASRVHLKKNNFLFQENVGVYADSPRYIKVGTLSTLIYDQDNLTYPRITGIDNFSQFSIDVLGTSFADIKTNGYHYIRNKGSNIAIPSVTTKLVDTDMGYRTSGEITSTSVANNVYFGLTAATAGRWNTARFRIGDQHFFYSNSMNALLYKNGSPTSDTDGVPTYLPVGARIGTTAQRPVAPFLFTGRTYLDTSLHPNGKLIVWNGTNWIDGATSAIV